MGISVYSLFWVMQDVYGIINRSTTTGFARPDTGFGSSIGASTNAHIHRAMGFAPEVLQ